MKAIAPLLILATLLASCAAPQRPAPQPQPEAPTVSQPRPVPTAMPLPPTPADWRDAPITPGTWRYFNDPASTADMPPPPRRSMAMFGASRNDDLVLLICDRSKDRVELSVGSLGVPISKEATPIRLVTTTATRPFMSDPGLSTNLARGLALRPNDPILDALAFSRGRFAIEVTGQPTLYLPSWPELSRVVEDCR